MKTAWQEAEGWRERLSLIAYIFFVLGMGLLTLTALFQSYLYGVESFGTFPRILFHVGWYTIWIAIIGGWVYSLAGWKKLGGYLWFIRNFGLRRLIRYERNRRKGVTVNYSKLFTRDELAILEEYGLDPWNKND